MDDLNDILKRLVTDEVTPDDALKKIMMIKKKDRILKKHEEEFSKIWQASDGRWKTKIPDDSKKTGKRLIAKSSLKDLEDTIVSYYIAEEKPKPTMASIYPDWIDFKAQATSMANASKIQQVWRKYYEGQDIVKTPLDELTAGDFSDFFLKTIKEKELTKKRFKELKSISNMLFDHAIMHGLAQINFPRQVRGFSDRIFKAEKKKPILETVYTKETKEEVIAKAWKQYEKTKNTAYLAVLANFSMGLRVGELVALRRSKITDGGMLIIDSEEVKKFVKHEDGTIHKEGFEIVDHTKTAAGVRIIPLTPNARKYIYLAIEMSEQRGYDSDFIFLDKKGERLHDHAINNVLRRLNGTRNSSDGFDIIDRPSGNHAIRKTCISELHDSMQIPDETLKNFAGHKDISTTQKYYIKEVTPLESKSGLIAQILDG